MEKNRDRIKIEDGGNAQDKVLRMLYKTCIGKKIVKLLMFVLSSDNDDESGETYREALNEITKLRLEVFVKYKNNLKEEDFATFNKKLDLLEQELKTRLYYIQNLYNYENDYSREGKSR